MTLRGGNSSAEGSGMEVFSCQKASLLDTLAHLPFELLFPVTPHTWARAVCPLSGVPHLSAARTARSKCHRKIRQLFRFSGFLSTSTYNNQVIKVQVGGPSCSNDPCQDFHVPTPFVCLKHNIKIIQVKEHRYEISRVNIEVPSPVSSQVVCLGIYSTNIFQAIFILPDPC